ncbi:MAG: hypothetical protein JRN20_18380 [Nitrososphaerota archaeon]|nr:hypothetical protein [Nitrososphaerota archaeon]
MSEILVNQKTLSDMSIEELEFFDNYNSERIVYWGQLLARSYAAHQGNVAVCRKWLSHGISLQDAISKELASRRTGNCYDLSNKHPLT